MKSQDAHRIVRILQLLAGILFVAVVIQLSGKFRFQWDLTEEKRYTISEASKSLFSRLKEPMIIEVYLDGELPANFQRFQNGIRDMLDRFAYYGGDNFSYRMIDPSIALSARSRNEFYQSLISSGLQPTNLTFTKDGKKSERLVFPGVIISYGSVDVAVNLLKGNRSKSPDEMLNQAIENLEYELAEAAKELIQPDRRKVGIIMGHGEPDSLQLAGLTNVILDKYDLFRINLPTRKSALTGYDVLIVAKPSEPFTTKEKYLLDQYVMNGGNLVLFIDALAVDMSQASGEGTIPNINDHKLGDLLFRYGVRINSNYIADLNCGDFPVVTGNLGDQPRIQMLPWPYFPVITNYGNHPITRNLDAIKLQFASSIDTVKAEGIKKTPLLKTSGYTKVMSLPFSVSFNDLEGELLPEYFQSGEKIMGYLLEGKFNSLFMNRIVPSGLMTETHRNVSLGSKIIVVADGDLIRNQFSLESNEPLPIGVDPYSKTTYANEDFLLKSLDYLTDEDGLILSRNKQIKIRPLDKVKIKKEAVFWKWLNMVVPLFLLAVLALVKLIQRRRKYAARYV